MSHIKTFPPFTYFQNTCVPFHIFPQIVQNNHLNPKAKSICWYIVGINFQNYDHWILKRRVYRYILWGLTFRKTIIMQICKAICWYIVGIDFQCQLIPSIVMPRWIYLSFPCSLSLCFDFIFCTFFALVSFSSYTYLVLFSCQFLLFFVVVEIVTNFQDSWLNGTCRTIFTTILDCI